MDRIDKFGFIINHDFINQEKKINNILKAKV